LTEELNPSTGERWITMSNALTHKRGGQPLKPLRVDMRWVGRCTYHEGEGWVELAWWPEILSALFGLKKNFTTYQLQQATALRSAYSWRMLELLSRFQSTGWAEYDIEDFATAMDATEKQRADFAKLRTKIIEPAKKGTGGKGRLENRLGADQGRSQG